MIAASIGSDHYTYNPTSLTLAPEITFVEDRYVSASSLTYPEFSAGSGALSGFFGPSFTYTVVPEASSIAWAGAWVLALSGLAVRRITRKH